MSTSTLLQFTYLVLIMNTYYFNSRYLAQNQGVAIDTTNGPSVARVFMGHLGKISFAHYEHNTSISYNRYIVVIDGAASCSNKKLP